MYDSTNKGGEMDEFDLSIESIVKEESEPELLFTRPEILLHPNIPTPLNSLAPRTLMKIKQWNIIRRKSYAKNNYCCWACGTHRNYDLVANRFDDDNGTLDCHEMYAIDYEAKTSTLVEFVAVCKRCHNYIHSKRVGILFDRGIYDEQDCWEIFTHGDSILIDSRMIPKFEVDERDYTEDWSEWKLVYDGKEYGSNFKSKVEHDEHYNK